jgi:hypothetical protein
MNISLNEIFNKYNCDKGSKKHGYDRLYEKKFHPIRENNVNLLEVGIYKGASIQSWVEYFPNANIYCIDIFRKYKKYPSILNHPRVFWSNHNSINPLPFTNILFDVIIDDGDHTYPIQLATFNNLIKYLKNNGTYFLEDYRTQNLVKKLNLPNSLIHYKKLSEILKTYNTTYHDLTHGYAEDSIILEIRK